MPQTASNSSSFPPIESALSDPNGLLAVGGELTRERLFNAYDSGIFPWFDDDQPLLWWSPDPRAVIYPGDVHISRSLKRTMRRRNYSLRVDSDFEQVITACAEQRGDEVGTWITAEMQSAYIDLHRAGKAHSFEVWDRQTLVGGLYGVAAGKVFSGESMFHRQTDASKIAFVFTCMQLKQWGFGLLDCQIENPHLSSLGVTTMDRKQFKRWLPKYNEQSKQQDLPSQAQRGNRITSCNTAFCNTQELLEKLL